MDVPDHRSRFIALRRTRKRRGSSMVVPSLKTDHDAARRRFWLAISGFVMALALLPFSYKVERRLETAVHIKGGESEKVDLELAQRFQSPYAHRLVLVISGIPDPDSAKGADALGFLTSSLRSVPGVSGAVSSLDWPDSLFTGNNGGALIIVGLDPHNETVEALVPKLRARADWMEGQLRSQYPNIKLEITGEAPLEFDLRKVSADDVNHAEERAMPVTLLLLLLAFGSLVAALLPLGVGVLSISMAVGAAVLLARYLHLSILVQNLATMLGLGLGIDYALLMVSRFREAISAGNDGPAASVIAARPAGRTLLISASPVAIGFLTLLTVPISEIRSIGIAGFLVAGMSVLLTNTIVPTALALLGPRINIGRLPFTPKLDARRAERTGIRWRQWGKVIVAHPWLALFVAGTPLLLLAWQIRRLDTSVPRGDWLPQAAESVHALHTLRQMDREGVVEALRIIIELPTDSIAQTDAGWNVVDRVTKRLASDPRCGRVISITTIAESNRSSLRDLSRETRRTFLSSDGQAALLEVLPASSVSLRDQVNWVRELRKTGALVLTGVPGATLLVGGIPALNADYETIIRDRFPSVTALIVGGTLFALLCGFRSVFVALKAIALNLFSVAASFGALVFVCQNGHGSRFLGVPGGTGSVFPLVPIVAFAIVFGLSMDYEVFLVARVLEARKSGLNEAAANPG